MAYLQKQPQMLQVVPVSFLLLRKVSRDFIYVVMVHGQPQPIPLMECLKQLQAVLLVELVWFLNPLQVPKANFSEETELGRHLPIHGEVFRIT